MEGFILDKKASYRIENVDTPVQYDYNLLNSDILVRLNKFGINSVQYKAPGDVMLLNGNSINNFSKWNVYIKQNDGEYVNNFSFPRTEKPNKTVIEYQPELAKYSYSYNGFSLTTEISIHSKKAVVVMKTTVKNTLPNKAKFNAVVSVIPYLNPAALALWDKPEWYVKTGLRKKDGFIDFYSKLFNPLGIVQKRRLMTFSFAEKDAQRLENDMAKYVGIGDYFHPYYDSGIFSIDAKSLSDDFDKNVYQEGYPAVYAYTLDFELNANEEKVLTQVLSIQDKELCGEFSEKELDIARKLLDDNEYNDNLDDNRKFYEAFCNKKRYTTNDKRFESFVNGFLPLQLYWVCGLDRGWPTGMQGTRDSATDYLGLIFYSPERVRKQIIHLLSCMRSDGWSLRQVSVQGKNGVHDTRSYCDSTAFVQELLYEYICYTNDFSILDENTTWLDNNKETTVLDHYIRGFSYYLDDKNIGEHGLTKLYAGDWLDPINQAGLQGRGESVTVSCQVYGNLINAIKLLQFINADKYKDLIDYYTVKAETFKTNINTNAFNKKGFYNGMFSDGGFWIFSDCDKDGKERIYSSANYYAISTGVAEQKQIDSVISKTEDLKCDCGYRLFAPSFKEHLDLVGRVASGDMPDGLWENGAVYNQGGNCFRARALSKANLPEKLYETIMYLLPYDNDKHDIQVSGGSPYAIVNCYQTLKYAYGKAGSPFLSGSVAMAVRIIFCDMFGIQCMPDKIIIKPCLTKEFSNSTLDFTMFNKRFIVRYVYGDGDSVFNNEIKKTDDNRIVIDKNQLQDVNEITVFYK